MGFQLDALDYKILKMLSENARRPYLEIARECGVSGAAIHQRVQKLYGMDVLKGAVTVINPSSLGYDTCAYVGLLLKEPSQSDMIMEAIRKIPEVVECHYTTGDFDLFIKIYALNNHHLLNIIHDKLQPLGLSRSETIISFNSAINRQLPIVNIPIVEDEEGEPRDNKETKEKEPKEKKEPREKKEQKESKRAKREQKKQTQG